MPPDPDTPDLEGEPVGAALARMRRQKRLTGAKLAAIVRMSQPKISRIERGIGLADPEDIGAIARALGADENNVAELMARAERSQDRMTDWRPATPSLAGRQKTMMDWELTAQSLRAFEPVLVPGPLQTSGYAKLVLRTFQRLAPMTAGDLTEPALLAAVSARLRRQEVLADRSKTFHFIIGEAVLKRRLYPPIEMLAQIHHLREVIARSDNVRIGIVPEEAPIDIPLMHNFFLYDDDLVVVDLYNTGLISRSHRDVESYRGVFDALDAESTEVAPFLARYEQSYIKQLQSPG
ncbi:helix-turn-helix domain-containing protein [Actinoplanes solisilvae]|uniref:helix-turn-helix domain-containing protein n=1 Tax=Actinoplanes solisilvae TaxID=2486853 RepID=UPI000FDAA180|nr:helix-turn-helix transcriptional regulator [Actinoplanes solisilvae]